MMSLSRGGLDKIVNKLFLRQQKNGSLTFALFCTLEKNINIKNIVVRLLTQSDSKLGEVE